MIAVSRISICSLLAGVLFLTGSPPLGAGETGPQKSLRRASQAVLTKQSSAAAPIIPQPQRVWRLPGALRFVPSGTGIQLYVRDTAAAMVAVSELCTTSVTLYGALPAVGQQRPLMIKAGIMGVDPGFDRLCKDRGIIPGDSLDREGYTLLLTRKGVLIAAREARGLFYGLMTLNQLLRGAVTGTGVLQAVRIIDWPDQQVRGVMDDISRGPVPTQDYFRQQIRRLAEMKVNTLTYYVEHVVATKSHPEFAPPGAALTIDEWRSLAEYARRYQIELVGGFQSFGHFDKILAQPRYAHLAEGKALLSPVYEESYTLLSDIYREMVPAFSAPFFMTHCDETFDLGKGPSKKLVDSIGIGRVYASHLLRLRKMLKDLGVRMMVWGDVLLEHQEVLDLIPKDVVIGTWTYDSLSDYHRYIRPFVSRGFDVLTAPGVLNSLNVLPNFRVSQANIQRFIRDGIADGALGTMTTVWDDGGSALFSRDWYGVAFAADRMWHCDTTDSTYDLRFDRAIYADSRAGASRGIRKLLEVADLTPTDGMAEQGIWSPVVPDSGQTLRLDVRDWGKVLAIACEAGSLFRSGKPLIHKGDLQALQFSADLYAAAARSRLGVLKASRSYGKMSREGVADALDILSSLEGEFARLKSRYATLWLDENELYSLDQMERNYIETIAALGDAGRRVQVAMRELEQGRPLPVPGEVRLAVMESDGRYFRDWLVTGPIPGDELERDLLKETGGEGPAAPAVTQEFTVEEVTYRWKRLSVRNPGVDFSAEYPASRGGIVYAYATLESPSSRTAKALLGVGGKCRLLVNGVPVFEQGAIDTLALDIHEAMLPLQKGTNRILLKVAGGPAGPWGFSLVLPGSDVRGRKNRYRIEQ